MIFMDEAHHPLTAEALIGRRVRHFSEREGAFDWEGVISKVTPWGKSAVIEIRRDDGTLMTADPMSICVRAVTDAMVERAVPVYKANKHPGFTFEDVRSERVKGELRAQTRAILEAAIER